MKEDITQLPLSELERRKEIVEWQLSFAKDRKVIEKRQQELEEYNKRIIELKNLEQ